MGKGKECQKTNFWYFSKSVIIGRNKKMLDSFRRVRYHILIEFGDILA